MANSLVVWPVTRDEDLRTFLGEHGIEPPAPTGRLPRTDELAEILREADWPYEPEERDGTWHASFRSRDGRWPPVSDMALLPTNLWFRLGPLYGPFHITSEVTLRCGPQFAFDGSGGRSCLITADTTYEQFHLAFADVPPPADRLDRGWTPLPT